MPAVPPSTGGAEKSVPYDRFAQVVSERNSLNARIAELEQGTSANEIARLKAALEEKEAGYGKQSREIELLRAGVTDQDTADLVDYYYGKLPAKDRPTVGDWLKSLKEKPDTVPVGLKHVFSAQTPGTPGTPVKTPPALGGGNAGAATPGSPKSAYTAADIMGMSPEQYKANRETILGGYRSRVI